MTSKIVRNALLFALAATSLPAEAPFTIVVADPPGFGFNDTTPAEPVGGNPGKTVGEQRLIALRHAAGIWSSKLDSPVPTRVRTRFASLSCNADYGTLASAGPMQEWAFRRTSGEFLPYTWYPAALANVIAGEPLDADTEEVELVANPNIGRSNCIKGFDWYYGLDGKAPEESFDMVLVFLHELAHGLGVSGMIDDPTVEPDGRDIYGEYVVDTTTGKNLNDMTEAERVDALTTFRRVAWNGVNVRRAAPAVLKPGLAAMNVTEPSSIAGEYEIVAADFGGAFPTAGVTAQVVAALDPADSAGRSTTDACSPLVNASQVAGRIALVDRGTCSFLSKARNVQTAGAIAMIIVNNVDATLPTVNGSDSSITIPVMLVNRKDGNAIKSVLENFGQVSVRLSANPERLRGTDSQGRPFLFTPSPYNGGSSLYHWDPSLWPNQLMEAYASPDISHTVEPPSDLTVPMLMDIGWRADFDGVPGGIDECPGSDRGTTLRIQSCDTGVTNTTAPNGCRLSDSYKVCSSENGFVGCIDSVSTSLMRAGKLAQADAPAIRACAVKVQVQ